MSMFNGIENADATAVGGKTPYFLEGAYTVRIKEVKGFANRNGVPFFIINAEIVESTNPERPPGMTCGQVIKMNQDMGPINVKRFVAAANGIDPNSPAANEEVTADVCDYVVSDEQPLAGLEMKLQCHQVTTKAGAPFTVHTWEKVEAA